MDFKSMKRKQLQALCKKHGLSANSTSSQMIENLSSILQNQEKIKRKGCLKGSRGSSVEDLGIFRGGSKKVTFVIQDEEEDEEFTINPVGKSKRKSIRRRSSVAPELGKRNKVIEKGSQKSVTEGERRTTRSSGLAEAVLWSPVIEKKKKKSVDGTEGARRNVEWNSSKGEEGNFGELPTTRSLRNRVVVVGGNEELVSDENPRTQKRKNRDKKEGNKKAAALLEESELNAAVGRKNLRKRSRNEDSVEDEPPRRSTRSSAKLEETVATEEGDVGRSKKRRKVVDEGIERAPIAGGTAKRSKGNTSNSDAMEAQSQGKDRESKGGGSTDSISDTETIAGPIRRLTRSSSALLEGGNFVFTVGKSDQDGNKVRKGKSQKQAKDRASRGGDSASLLPASEVVAPVRRSTRSSSTLLEDGTSLPVIGKSNGSEAFGKGKSEKQAKHHGSKGGGSSSSLPASEVVSEPLRRSTCSSSTLMEDGTSLPVVGKSVKGGEAVIKGKSKKQAKAHVLRGGSTTSLPDSVVIAEPTRRSTRSSSSLLENQASLPVVGKPVKEDDTVRKGKSRRHGEDSALEGGVSTASLSVHEAISEPTSRLTRSSSKLLESEAHLPAIGKSGSDDEAIRNDKPRKQRKGHASKLGDSTAFTPNNVVTEPASRSTRSSSKLSEDSTFSPVRKDNSRKMDHTAKQTDSTASLRNNETVTTPTRRLTHSSLTLLKDETPNNETITASTRRSTRSSSMSLKDEMPNNETVTTTTRRSTRSSSTLLKDETPNNEAVTTRRSSRSFSTLLKGQGSVASVFDFKAAAQTGALEVHEQREELPRRPTRSASKRKESRVSAVLLTASDEILGKKQKKKRTSEAAFKEDIVVMERETVGGFGCRGDLQVNSTNSRRKSMRKVPADSEAVQRLCSPNPTSSLLEDDKNVSEMRQSPVNVQLQEVENGTSLVGAPKDLDEVCFGSQIKEKQSSFQERENEGRSALSLNFIEDSSEIQENVSRQLVGSNDVTVVAEGTFESYGNGKGKVLAPVELTSTMKDNNRVTFVGALDDVDGMAGMESQNIPISPVPLENSVELLTTIHPEISTMVRLKEPDSAVAIDIECVDILTVHEATHVSGPQLQCKSSEELSLMSNTEASPVFDLEEPNLKGEISDSNEDVLEGKEATDNDEPILFCKSSEEISPAADTEASPEIGLEEPDSKAEVDRPAEDVMEGSGATKIIDSMTSDTEVGLKHFRDINVEESDSKVAVHFSSKGGVEGSRNIKTAGSPLSCKSIGVLLPTLLNEVSLEIGLGEPDLKVNSHDMSKAASHSNDSRDEASGIRSKTLEFSMTADRNAGDLSSIQRIFDNEMENCNADLENILNSQLAQGKCDAGKKIEAPAGDSDLQSCKGGLEVIKETWVSSTLSVTANDGIETEGGKNDAEKNGDEPRPSSPSEITAFALFSDDHLKEHGTQSSKEIADGEMALRSHCSAKQYDLTQSLYDKDPSNAEGNLRNSSDDKFCEDNNDRLLSPVAFVKPDGPSNVLPMAYKEHESSHSKIGVESSEITEGKSFVDHRSSIESLVASSKLVKQMEKEDGLHDVYVESKGFSALTNDNRSLSDAVLFGGLKEVADEGNLPTLPLSLTGSEENFPTSSTKAPTMSGYEGSTKQVGIQDFPCVPDSEHTMPSDQQGITVNVTESLVVDSVHRSSRSPPKGHDALEPLSGVADILPETADIANELTDVEFERGLELDAVVEEEVENIESSEEDSIERDNDTVMKKSDSTGQDHFDGIGQKRDEAFLLQEIKGLSGELHTDDIASPASVENSGEEMVLSLQNFPSSTYTKNESNVEKEDGTKTESRLPCNVHEEKHTAPSTTEHSYLIPADTFKFKGTFESFGQASDVEEAWVAPGATPVFVEDLFHIDSEVATFVNDSAQVGQLGHHEENSAHGKFGSFVGIDEALAREDEMKAVVVSGSSRAEVEEACSYGCEMAPKAENLSGGSAKPCVDVDSQATYSSEQSDGQEKRRKFIQEEGIVSKDEIMGPDQHFEDFDWSFADNVDVDSSHHEVREVDSELPTELTLGNSADRSSKSVIDVNKEQNKRSELDQI